MFTDTEIVTRMEAGQPGVRQAVINTMLQEGMQPRIPACGLCQAPVANGCEHVVVFAKPRVSMRQMVRRKCRNCQTEWTQPARVGACKECGSRDVVNLDEMTCGVPRA